MDHDVKLSQFKALKVKLCKTCACALCWFFGDKLPNVRHAQRFWEATVQAAQKWITFLRKMPILHSILSILCRTGPVFVQVLFFPSTEVDINIIFVKKKHM